jgi:translation initiation factor 2B subunit (eIF-2B alpha/beta/delta family)
VFMDVEQDRSRGSRDLTRYLLDELLIWALEQDELDTETVKTICRRITQLRPEMAAVCSLGYLLWDRVKDGESPVTERLRDGLRDLREEQEQAGQRIYASHQDADFDDRDVMTFSRSSTVLDLLKRVDAVEKSVVLHSYPGEEGIDMSEDLQESLDVTIAYDVEAGYFLPKVDALYIGVDCLFHDGSIVNKTGTRLLAAASGQTPVRCVTDIWKLTRVDAVTDVPRFPSPEGTPDELTREHPIFETIQPELIDTYITNRGTFHRGEKLVDALSDIRAAHRELND